MLDDSEMEYDISESLLTAMRFLKVKIEHNLTDVAFQKTMTAFDIGSISLHKAKMTLKSIVHIKPIWIDMCRGSCCTYTENYKELTKCLTCGAKRYQHNTLQPCQQYSYFSLIERLIIQYGDYDRAKELRYRANYISQKSYKRNIQIGDIFDGDRYKELVKDGYFQDERDVALIASVDGYQIFRQKTDDCWILLFINANLAPETRVKKDNFLIGAIIPGPKEPKDFNSFLAPIVLELQKLEGIIINLI